MKNKKKTKIICTISDDRCNPEFLKSLYESGMNVVRINSAHNTEDTALKIVENVRKVSDKIAILIDTKGPEVRLCPMDPVSGISVKAGDKIKIKNDVKGICSNDVLYTNYYHFVNDVPVGATILIDDGDVALTVEEKTDDTLHCTIMNNGTIKGKKSVNIPSVTMTNLPSLTQKDKEFIIWAIKNELDFVAHSFVRSKSDLDEIYSIINEHNSHLKIISKIENQEGVDNILEILKNSYGIMVARGDLGIEIAAEKIPVIQREIVKKCRLYRKPVIIATQMLHTMIENPRPTRAEVTDVANAIYQYTDAIMLSGETAYGKYPLEAVSTMAKIAYEIESQHMPSLDMEMEKQTSKISSTLARAMVEASTRIPIKAIVIDSSTGRTGRYVSAFRPNIPVFCTCYKEHVMRELALSYGIYSKYSTLSQTKDSFVKSSVTALIEKIHLENDEILGILAGNFGDRAGASFIEIASIDNLVK